MNMQDVYKWIEDHHDEQVAELQTLLRQPSISAQNIGLDECAELLKDQMLENGISNVRRIPVEDGPDLVYAT
jgi:acetylornithine deacetylase/succinyl-diaminopimelate desuccinylase-like protein